MYIFFVFFIVQVVFFSPIFGLTTVNFDNGYAVFRPTETGLGFDLENQLEILFLEGLGSVSRESCRYALKITRNHSAEEEILDFIIYKNGIVKDKVLYDLEDKSCLQNMELAWDTSANIHVSVKKTAARRSTAFSWTDTERENSSPVNITHIALKASHPTTIRQRDTFLWITDVFSACPHQQVEVVCALNVPRHRATFLDDRNNSSVNKGVRKVMEMRLISKSNPQHNYEMVVAANQTTDKIDPRLHIMQQNATKLKMDVFPGLVDLGVNMSSGHIVLIKRNDSMPFLLWKDASVAVKSSSQGFQGVRYVTVEVSESPSSSRVSHNQNNGKSFANACKLSCKSLEDTLPWYTRWKNKFVSAFTRSEPVVRPVREEDESDEQI